MGVWDTLKRVGAGVATGGGSELYRGAKWLSQEPASTTQQRDNLNNQGAMSSWFADQGQQGYQQMGAEAAAQRDAFRRLASGQDSLSAEQLRQGLQSTMSAQRSMAASASPANSPMAALHAAQNMGRLGAGMSGQAALAGIQERAAANKALSDMIMQGRQQDANIALGARQNAISGYGGIPKEQSNFDKAAPFLQMGADAAAAAAKTSDRNAKHDIEDGNGKANRAIEAIAPYVYRYKNPAHGTKRELGVMAQDLEAAGLGHAVRETDDGTKIVDIPSLATANTAMIAALGKRVAELEEKLATIGGGA